MLSMTTTNNSSRTGGGPAVTAITTASSTAAKKPSVRILNKTKDDDEIWQESIEMNCIDWKERRRRQTQGTPSISE